MKSARASTRGEGATGRQGPSSHRSRSLVGRADLVQIALELGDDALSHVARGMGFEAQAPLSMPERPAISFEPNKASLETPVASELPPEKEIRFLRLEEAQFAAEDTVEKGSVGADEGLTEEEIEGKGRSLFATPPVPTLAPWRKLWPSLRERLQVVRTGRAPDVAKLVLAMGRGKVVSRIPRLVRRAWTQRLSLWVDWSARLIPLFQDQAMVRNALEKVCGRQGMTVRVIDERHAGAPDADPRGRPVRVDAQTPILVLGDLGIHGSAVDQQGWTRAAARLRASGVRWTALVPTLDSGGHSGVTARWNALRWERTGSAARRGLSPERTPERTEALLTLASAAVIVQPGLLRALRRLLPAWDADVSTELDVWSHSAVRRAAFAGMVLDKAARDAYRVRLAGLDEALLQRVSETVRRWHLRLPVETLHAETIAWSTRIATDIAPPPGDAEEAADFVRRFANSVEDRGQTAVGDVSLRRGSAVFLSSVPPDAYRDERFREGLWRLRASTFEDAEAGEPPPCAVSLVGKRLVLRRAPENGAWAQHAVGEPGSPVAWLRAEKPRLRVSRGLDRREEWEVIREGLQIEVIAGEEVVLETDRCRLVLRFWSPESWASGVGRDRFGLWADAEVKGVVQRFRWIPPGRFWMGSPEDEQGRFDNEGPQHRVTFTRGYWLAETPCTQALWEAVMGSNPSEFVSPDRPVEQVSWNDCQTFLERVAALVPGLEPRLPREGEWEHACRAGTTRATWLGDLVIVGVRDAPLLNTIAWYGGNCGVDFDLPNGEDTSEWLQEQFPHQRGGTRSVGRKDPNPMGLLDVLGNLFEWCADGLTPYDSCELTDPQPSPEGVDRVVRGGSWDEYARYCRAAYRGASVPGGRGVNLGFRLARGRAPRERAEPQEGARSALDRKDEGVPGHQRSAFPRLSEDSPRRSWMKALESTQTGEQLLEEQRRAVAESLGVPPSQRTEKGH